MIRTLTFVATLVAGPVLAETVDASAKGMGASTNEMTAIADGHMVMKTASVYEGFETEGPFNGATGECFGAAEIKSGVVDGSGLCLFQTEGDETAIVSWVMNALGEGGATMGEWEVTGGTGKWANASGGGAFTNTTDPDSGQFENVISGDVTFN